LENNFIINLIASLQKAKSKQQIKNDAKNLGDIPAKLVGKLDLSKTRKNIQGQLKGLTNLDVKISPKMVTKGVQDATKQAIRNSQRVADSSKVELRFETDKAKLLNQIKILGKNNSKLFGNSDMAKKYNQILDSANVAKSKSELKDLRGQLSAFRTELVATNNAGMSWTDKFKASISRYTQFFSGASFVYAMANQLRNAATEAKQLDDRLVDLQKVTDEIADRDALYQYFDKAMNKAQELNVKVDSLIYAITEFKKLGWSLSDAEMGGEWATILENVGDVDIDTAIGSIKTAIASFDEIGGYTDAQMDKKLEAYVDLINNMSNKYSIDAEGLSEAIRLSAGTLTEAHMSIEQAATMFATANKFYNDPNYLAHTAKIGSLRIRASEGDDDAKSELEELGEQIDELSESTSSLREKLLGLTGVDIMIDDHTFKSYYDQLYEISQVIDDLSDTNRANVLETLFGKNRSAGGAALLSGMKESAGAYQDAINSAGSATQEYEIWMQSADAASQRFANNLTKAYQSIINGDTVRDLANLGSALLEFANNFGIVEGTLRGFVLLGVGKFFTTLSIGVVSATKSIEQYGKALTLASNIPDGNLKERYKSLKSIASAMGSLTTEQQKQVLSSKNLTQQDRIRILQMSGMSKEMAEQKLAEMGLTEATNAQTAANVGQTASTFSLKAALVGLGQTIKSVFLSNPLGIALMAISVGISAITSVISNHKQELEEMNDKTKAAAEEANTLGDEITELASKYISLSEAIKSDEDAKEDLISTQTELLKKLGLEGEGIDELIEKYGSLSNAIRQASIDSLKEAEIDLIAGVGVAKQELLDDAKDGFFGNKNIISVSGDDAIKAFKELEKAGIVDKGSYGSGGGSLVLAGDDSVEGALENFHRLENAINVLRDSEAFTAEELSNNLLFQAIYKRYGELKDGAESYMSAIENLNENLSQQMMLTALQGKEMPKTEEAFDAFRQELIDAAVASERFIGSEEEIANAINNYLAKVPEFAGFFSIPLKNELDKVEGMLNTSFSIQLSTETEGLEGFFSAVKESVSSTGLAAESMQKLEERYKSLPNYSPEKLFEKTTNGIHLNVRALRDLESAYEKQQKSKIDDELKNLVEQYNDLTEQIESCTNAEERASLYSTRAALKEQIDDTSILAAQYEGLTSAFYKWEQAQSMGEEGDMYDSITGGLENIKELYEKGLIGTNKFKSALELMTGKDMSNASSNELLAAYEEAYPKMMKYFTDGQDGCINFLSDLEGINKEWVKLNDDGSWDINFGIGNDKEIADALGISEEAVQAIMRKLVDYNFDINLDSVYSDLGLLQTKAEKANEKLIELGKTDISFNFNTTDIDSLDRQITDAMGLYDTFRNEDGTINLELEGAKEVQYILVTLIRQKQELSKPFVMRVDASEVGGQLGSAIQLIEDFSNKKDEIDIYRITGDTDKLQQAQVELQEIVKLINLLPEDVKVALGLDDEKLKALFAEIENADINVPAGVELDEESVNGVLEFISTISPEVLIAAGVDPTLVDNYIEEKKVDEGNTVGFEVEDKPVQAYLKEPKRGKGFIKFTAITTAVDLALEKYKNVTIGSSGSTGNSGSSQGSSSSSSNKTSKTGYSDRVKVDGTFHAHANGTDVGIKHDEEAIVNELGEEGLIRNGVFTKILGGMRKMRLKAGDIILNHKQVEELEKNGYVTSNGGRGKLIGAHSLGAGQGGGNNTFYSNGKVVTKPSGNSNSNSKSSTNSNNNSTSEEAESTLETYDWVERKIESIHHMVEILNQVVDRTYRNWTERNQAIGKEMSLINDEIEAQTAGFWKYLQRADESGLSDYYKNLVKDGAISIEDIEDEALQEQIADYQEWFEKAKECGDAIEDLKDDLADLAKTNFDHVAQEFEDQIGVIEHTMDMIDGYIDQTEERGYLVATNYYDNLIKMERDNVSVLQKEYDSLTDALAQAMASGNIEKYSEDWYDMYSSILDVDKALQDATTSLYEYQNAMRELEWSYFETKETYISRLTEESDWLIGLLENQGKLIDDNGNFTDAGIAAKGLHAVNYNTYMSQADDYAEEIRKINKELAKDPYNTILIEKRNDLLKLQRESIDAAYDEIDAVKDLISDAYDKQLDALQEVIDKRKDALNAEKDLYDYQKSIAEKTNKVSSLEKQLNAYAGDTSEEGKATIQQLKVDLENAKSDLEETEYDKWLSDQERLMDDLYNEYEMLLNQRLDDINFIMNNMIDSANNNATSIMDTLGTATTSVGTTLSDNMKAVWTSGGGAYGVVTKYGDNLTNGLFGTSGIATTLETIKNLVNAMASESQQKAAQQAAEQTARQQAASDKAPASSPLPSNTPPPQNAPASSDNGTDTSFFIHRSSDTAKNKLNINTSIMDRLKYHDFDWSFNTCGMYYSKMGFNDHYRGTAEQNINMLNWMKSHGLYRGGEIGDLIDKTNDTGFALVKTGETVLTEQATRNLKDALNLINPFVESVRKMSEDFVNESMSNVSNEQNVGNVTLDIDNITLPNVKNYDEFKTALLSDSHFEKVMGQAMADKMMGGNSLNKFRFMIN